ncbi:TPR-like protein [Gonapodya prolifera JEL478]|uniref:Outer dynein arm-docking complex subunit 4 n=1 Tax=Gonapodya prolifera (strain JEL478) TaxID=1344416 RepID=A0A139AKJ6_GONPJ|nr:TPR-like protein [Gonapodya prolifera JEL478]|eukprot:KXS17064.1 TPR-like protein [Gonapodya prolifera JEL478]
MAEPKSPPEPVRSPVGGGMVDPALQAFHTAFAEAELHFRHGDATTALSKYNAALEARPGDRAVLLARSRCLLSLGLAKQALQDADALLALEKENARAILLRAEALFASGNFENALVWFHRGARLKPEIDEFRLGIQKAQESILSGIGIDPEPTRKVETVSASTLPSPTPAVVATQGHQRRNTVAEGAHKLAAFKALKAANGSEVDARKTKPAPGRISAKSPSPGSKPGKTVTISPLQVSAVDSHETIHRDHIYLGPLSVDKAFLHELMNDPTFASNPNEEVTELAQNGVKYLEERCEFWRRRLGSSAESHRTRIEVKGLKRGMARVNG